MFVLVFNPITKSYEVIDRAALIAENTSAHLKRDYPARYPLCFGSQEKCESVKRFMISEDCAI